MSITGLHTPTASELPTLKATRVMLASGGWVVVHTAVVTGLSESGDVE